jgi:4-azaleucine resistance transporter AzlC
LRTTRGSGWTAGIVRALPIVAGYLPIGFGYGALATDAGISTLHTVLMSIVVYAGASQLIAVGLLAAGVPALSIVATTFVVNVRHLIMTLALAPYLVGWRRSELAAFAFQVTDETFGMHASQFAAGSVDKPASFATNIISQCAWVAGTGLGIVAGHAIGDVRRFGLDFALPAMFLALLTIQTRTWVQVFVALVSAILAAALLTMGLGHWTTPIAAAAAAAVGVTLHRALTGGDRREAEGDSTVHRRGTQIR